MLIMYSVQKTLWLNFTTENIILWLNKYLMLISEYFADSYSILKEYEKERLRHNLPTMIAIDLMNKLYSSSNALLLTLGHVALQFTNCAPPVKVR